MTADSYSPTKEQIKDIKMVNNDNKNVVLEVGDRHFLFKCVSLTNFDKAVLCLAELIGTCALLFLVCVACVEGLGAPVSNIQTALGGGLAVLTVVSIFGGISHCHINPAVTLAAAICRIITVPMAIAYMICQLIGGILGFGILRMVTPLESHYKANSTVGLCMTLPNETITPYQGFVVEFCITTLLIWLCCAVWDPRNSRWQDSVSMKFGFTVVMMSLGAGPLTGASMNPVRSLAPALYANNWTDNWVYWTAPIIASIFASLCYKYVFHRDAPKCCCTVAILHTELATEVK